MKKILLLGFSFVILFSSCVKKPDIPVGEVKIRFVNALRGSLPQDVYINSGKVNVPAVEAGQATAYLPFPSGVNYLAMANTGTTTANGDIIPYNGPIGGHATFFYTQNLAGGSATGLKEDDMTAPPSGKARVRFIHLNSFLNNSIRVNVVGGADLFSVLGFGSASLYYNVDPGSKFQVSATGVITAPVIDANIQAGKIYTFFFNGSTATELFGNMLIQN